MEIKEEELQKIEKYAALFFSIKEVAAILDKDKNLFFYQAKIEGSKINLAYNKGKLLSELAIRDEIIETAKRGSPAAQEQALKMISKLNTNNV